MNIFRECPWPESVWPMTDDEYVKAVPDPKKRTAISGFLMRKGWELCRKEMLKTMIDIMTEELEVKS
jgi:hypothetical protein